MNEEYKTYIEAPIESASENIMMTSTPPKRHKRSYSDDSHDSDKSDDSIDLAMMVAVNNANIANNL